FMYRTTVSSRQIWRTPVLARTGASSAGAVTSRVAAPLPFAAQAQWTRTPREPARVGRAAGRRALAQRPPDHPRPDRRRLLRGSAEDLERHRIDVFGPLHRPADRKVRLRARREAVAAGAAGVERPVLLVLEREEAGARLRARAQPEGGDVAL